MCQMHTNEEPYRCQRPNGETSSIVGPSVATPV